MVELKIFLLGCPCGQKIKVNIAENRKEIRCEKCKRYIKVPNLRSISPNLMTTQSLLSNKNDNMISKVLAKRFRIESHIAEGAMGKVYRGTDLILKKSVAIKILKLDSFPLEMQERYQKRFINEARIGLELIHPNIVPVRSVHKTKRGTLFFVMDFCPGQSLRNILIQKKRLPVKEAIIIAHEILLALQIAHEKGVAHRDIKPGNIMVEYSSEKINVRVLDFGVAKIFAETSGLEQETLTKTGYIIGTTRYMAPEQILSEDVGGHTDIYAVGALMYHMISGTTPFSGTRQKVLKSILRTTPITLKKLCIQLKIGTIPDIVDAIIAKSLEKEPKKRFRNAREFANALNYDAKTKIWCYSLIAQVNANRIIAKLDKKMRVIIPISLLLFSLFFFYMYSFAPHRKHMYYVALAQSSFGEEKYSIALEWVSLAEKISNNDVVKLWREKILIHAFSNSLKLERYEEAQYFLEKLKQNNNIFEHIAQYFDEEIKIYNAGQVIETKAGKKALKILNTIEKKHKENDWLRKKIVEAVKEKK